MNRTLLATVSCSMLLSLSVAFADGSQKPRQPELYTGSIQQAQPLRACKVRYINGQVVQVGPWIELSQFSPAGGLPPSPCGEGNLAFDNVEFADGTLSIGENTKYGDNCADVPDQNRWYLGADYRNPLWVNDMIVVTGTEGGQADALFPAWYMQRAEGNTSNFYMVIFTGEYADGTLTNFDNCDDTDLTIYDGVAFDFGSSIGTGGWFASICLAGTGLSLQMPNSGQGVYLVGYFSDPTNGTQWPDPVQPLLWGTKPNNPSQQGPTQWDDDNPSDGQITLPDECYDYTYNVCPDPLGGMMAFWVSAAGCQPNGGDVDGNGCVDDADLLAVLFAFGSTGSGLAEDVNCDEVVDDADLLEVLFNFGTGCDID